MIRAQSPSPQALARVPLATAVHRDLEVGRYDHVPQDAPWLRDLALEAARVASVPIAAINLMRSTTQRTVAAVGTDAGVHARAHALCDRVVDEGRTTHVADVSLDERWAHNPFVDGRWGRVRFYGGHPLLNPSGFVVGTLCVLDERPRELEAHQVMALDALAARVVAQLEESRLDALRATVLSARRPVRR